uniref:Uncharacterized protein n=1 Tax=Ciona savignyi TaxID=51511 RepID=H2YT81_CIOSA
TLLAQSLNDDPRNKRRSIVIVADLRRQSNVPSKPPGITLNSAADVSIRALMTGKLKSDSTTTN